MRFYDLEQSLIGVNGKMSVYIGIEDMADA